MRASFYGDDCDDGGVMVRQGCGLLKRILLCWERLFLNRFFKVSGTKLPRGEGIFSSMPTEK